MSTTQNKFIPQLRFPEFRDDWKKWRLGNIAKFSKGKNLSKNDIVLNGSNECIRYGELYTRYTETIDKVYSKTNLKIDESIVSEANDIIIPASGETQLDIATASCVLRKGIILGGDLNIVKTNNNGVFLSYYLNNKKKLNIAKLSQGSSVIHLYSKQLSLLKLNLPKLNEQQKIASFLTDVDTKITQLTKKKSLLEKYKKGIMQKIFNQELRFKDDDGNKFPEWEEKKLGDLLNYEQPTKYIVASTEYDDSFKIPVLTAGKSFILGYTDEVNDVYNKLPAIIFDDFTMANKYVDFHFKVKSSAMKILQPKNKSVNMIFVYESIQMINYPKGNEHKRFWISEYSKIKIDYPCINEQSKIANFLSDIDIKIEALQTKIEHTKTFKKGLLQQMFV